MFGVQSISRPSTFRGRHEPGVGSDRRNKVRQAFCEQFLKVLARRFDMAIEECYQFIQGIGYAWYSVQ